MNVIALSQRQFGLNLDLLAAMFRLRRRVFKERLDWRVSVSGDLELDVYDALNPTYLVMVSGRREVVGCVRLLPTTGPTMLADTFPQLLNGQALARSNRILESSRFCVDTTLTSEAAGNGLNRATFILFAAWRSPVSSIDRARRSWVCIVRQVSKAQFSPNRYPFLPQHSRRFYRSSEIVRIDAGGPTA
jgi:acyl homoserine lactone synthase